LQPHAVAARTKALAEARTQWKVRKGGDADADAKKMPADEMKSDTRSQLDLAPIAPVAPGAVDRTKVVRADGLSDGADSDAGKKAIQARFDVAMTRCGTSDAADRHTCLMQADDACKDALAEPDRQGDDGGRFEKTLDDGVAPDEGPYRNVSTARHTPADVGASTPMVN
jgi:hypothetical protein